MDQKNSSNQFTKGGQKALELMIEYSEKYPKNFFGQAKINIRHSLLVCDFGLYLQKLVGGKCEVVKIATLFHDLGKISVVEGHEELIVLLIHKHKNDFQLSQTDFELLVKVCSEESSVKEIFEYKILHCADNLAFLYDAQYQEAFYRYIGTKKLLFEKRIDPKLRALNLEPARILGNAFYENASLYWKKRPEEASERYRPDIEGRDLPVFTDLL